MGDLIIIIVVIVIIAGISFLVAAKLAAKFPRMSRRRILVLTPLPVPGLLAALCIYVLIDAYTAPAEECGVDACGMAAAAGFVGFSLAILFYAAGMWAAALAIRRTQPSIAEAGSKIL